MRLSNNTGSEIDGKSGRYKRRTGDVKLTVTRGEVTALWLAR
jgi:hypothetical protein